VRPQRRHRPRPSQPASEPLCLSPSQPALTLFDPDDHCDARVGPGVAGKHLQGKKGKTGDTRGGAGRGGAGRGGSRGGARGRVRARPRASRRPGVRRRPGPPTGYLRARGPDSAHAMPRPPTQHSTPASRTAAPARGRLAAASARRSPGRGGEARRGSERRRERGGRETHPRRVYTARPECSRRGGRLKHAHTVPQTYPRPDPDLLGHGAAEAQARGRNQHLDYQSAQSEKQNRRRASMLSWLMACKAGRVCRNTTSSPTRVCKRTASRTKNSSCTPRPQFARQWQCTRQQFSKQTSQNAHGKAPNAVRVGATSRREEMGTFGIRIIRPETKLTGGSK
jgi:hypothetical protein